jgi:VWFA-related protein
MSVRRRLPTRPAARVLVLGAAFSVAVAAQTGSGQRSPDQPTFRLDANFVRVDLYATLDGRPVTDLAGDEIEIREDGVPQAIETFEHVSLTRGVPVEQRRDPDSVSQMRAEAANPRARLFVIYLDTAHTTLSGSHAMKRTLVTMLDRMLAPDDLFAVMTPYMSPTDLAFARKNVTVEGYLTKYWTWGERDFMLPQNPEERNFLECFPDRGGNRRAHYSELAEQLVMRRREKVALDSLTDLTLYLRGLREERKAVIAISNGWLLPRPDPSLMAQGEAPRPEQMGTTSTGRITADRMREEYGVSHAQCERERQLLAFTDFYQEFQDLMDTANRANVSFYPVDSRGLAASDTPVFVLSDKPPIVEARLVQARVESLRTLAENTDGLAVVDTNALDRGISRIVDDMTSYYLLGYYSSNTKLDGRFRKISVRVKRPGVEVRARRGYKALSASELAPPPATTSAPAGPAPAIQAALSTLTVSRTSQLRTTVGFARSGGTTPARLVAGIEVDAAAAKGGFATGAELAVVAAAGDGTVLAQKRATLPAGARSALVDLGLVPLLDRDFVIRVRATPAAEGSPLTETAAVAAGTDASGLIWRRGPTTGMKYVLTADRRISRADRIRVEVPVPEGVSASGAALLDRAGSQLDLPVTATIRADGGVQWATAELALAPLAPGEYVLRLTLVGLGEPREMLTAIRVTP